MIINLQTLADTRRNQLYTLQNGRPLRATNPLEWLRWMNRNPRLIEATMLPNDRELVTIFAGYADSYRDNAPLVYCTTLKPEPQLPHLAVPLRWYLTENEARAGHKDLAMGFRKPRLSDKQVQEPENI